MSEAARKLGSASSAFAVAGAITVLFNTALTCVKDAYAPVANFLASLTGQNWTTQGLADVALFVGLGLILAKTGVTDRVGPGRVILFLIAAVVLAGAGLLIWFALF